MELTKEEIIARLVKEYPNGVTLRYVDYRDDLDDNPDVMAAILRSDRDYVNDQIDKRYDDWTEIMWIIDQVFTSEEYSDNDTLHDVVSERCRDNDDSDPVKDLIRNTSDPLAYYDTGYYFDSPDYYTKEEMRTECIKACRAIGIHIKFAKKLQNLWCNASYGWALVLIINVDLSDFYNRDSEPKYIHFNDTVVWIIHFGNGSGDYENIQISEKDLSFTYEPERLVIDSTEKYWIQDIFWCWRNVGWDYTLSDKQTKTTKCRLPWESEAAARQKREVELNAIYKAWWCTAGDMDMSRHRRCYYTTEGTCWTRCPTCQTFWID